jgi:hypothetical protein
MGEVGEWHWQRVVADTMSTPCRGDGQSPSREGVMADVRNGLQKDLKAEKLVETAYKNFGLGRGVSNSWFSRRANLPPSATSAKHVKSAETSFKALSSR